MPGTLPKYRILELQEGGSGSTNWIPLMIERDIGSIKTTSPDGGEIEITSHYGRDYKTGRPVIINQVQSGVPAPFTFDVSLPIELRQTLQKFKFQYPQRVG